MFNPDNRNKNGASDAGYGFDPDGNEIINVDDWRAEGVDPATFSTHEEAIRRTREQRGGRILSLKGTLEQQADEFLAQHDTQAVNIDGTKDLAEDLPPDEDSEEKPETLSA